MNASPAKQAQTVEELRQQIAEFLQRENATAKELQDCKRQLAEALEQQTATSEILGVIASSPTDIQPVLDTVAENAARITGSDDAVIDRVHGDNLIRAAKYGPHKWGPLGEIGQRLSRGTPAGRAVIDRQVMHVSDLLAAPLEFPDVRRHIQYGSRTVLSTPLLREGVPIGAIHIRRPEVRPFSEKHIALLKTFADQAVIAIENVRLFKELGERNAELREALEHQTATAEVLGIISRSPTDVQPVLDAIVESAARVCGIDDVVLRLREGDSYGFAGSFWSYTDAAASRSVLMSHSFAGCASMARSIFPTSASRTISQRWVPSAAGAPSWPFPFASKGNSLGD